MRFSSYSPAEQNKITGMKEASESGASTGRHTEVGRYEQSVYSKDLNIFGQNVSYSMVIPVVQRTDICSSHLQSFNLFLSLSKDRIMKLKSPAHYCRRTA